MAQFLPYIQNLRGLAILIVVSVHARGYDSNWKSNLGFNHFFDVFFDPSEGNGTILFLFIGGFLFQHLNHHHFNFASYLDRKFKMIILPYILISIPLIIVRIYTGFDSLTLPDDFHEYSPFYQFFYYLITGAHLAPFWFLSVIIMIYLSSPLLHLLDNEKFYRYLFPVIFLIGLFTFRPQHNANPFLAYLHFLPVYLAGMWASFYKTKLFYSSMTLLIVFGMLYVSISIADLLGWITLSRKISFENVLYDQVLVFNIFFLKAILFCFIMVLTLYQLRDRKLPLLEVLGQYSFGIYFVHYIFISVLRQLMPTLNFSVLTYVIYFLFILLISFLTVFIVKKISGQYSRYLIGS
jgi:surface polysaccharide O-acyltransferase-like enzyme